MTEQIVQIPPSSTGLKMRLQEITAGANTVEMENVVISDPTTAANQATVSAAGALAVDGSAVTQPVSGTFWQSTQPVSAASLPLPTGAATAAKQPALGTAGTASTDVITVQGIASGTAQPVSAASLPLPTGASTAAKQPALGTAGSAASDVITVQGVASMTKLLVTPDLPSGASTAAKQPALGTAGSASADVITIQGVASMTKLLVTPDSVALPANQSVNVAQVNGTTSLVNAGAVGTGSPRVAVGQDTTTIAGSAPGTAGSASANVVTVQGVASMTKLLVTPDSVALPANQSVNVAQINGTTPLMGNGTTGTGSHRVTVASDNTANSNPWLAQAVPATSGGLPLPFSVSLTSTKQQVKATAGQVYGFLVVNNGSALCYIQVFNLASASVTVGSTTPDWVIPVPAPSSGSNGAGVAHAEDLGIAHSTGITVACTTTRTGSTTATCDVLFFYK